MAERLVYSTSKQQPSEPANSKKSGNAGYLASEGPTKARLERKGRGGKTVTVLFNLPFSEAEAKTLMRTLQTRLGCGATMKDSTIELRGDVREKIADYFKNQGWPLVRAGG